MYKCYINNVTKKCSCNTIRIFNFNFNSQSCCIEPFPQGKEIILHKILYIYEEEQVNKCREGRKAIPKNKMPDLGWDIAETKLQTLDNTEKPQEPVEGTTSISVPLQTIITVTVLITTILQHMTAGIQGLMRKTTQAVKFMTTEINRSNFIKNIKKTYKSTMLAITIATRTADRNSHTIQHRTTNRQQDKSPGTQKNYDQYEG